MIRATSTVRGLVAAVYAVLHLLVAAGVPVADARAEVAAQSWRGPHVESTDAGGPHHAGDHSACELCRALRNLPVAAARSPVLAMAVADEPQSYDAPPRHTAEARTSPLGARAPPVLA